MNASPRTVLPVVAVIAAVLAGGWMLLGRQAPQEMPAAPLAPKTRAQLAREKLFEELQPVRLANCTLQRFGEPHDGGYLMCGNLLGEVRAGYSYGISGYDGWGCDISRQLGVRVHQYDCFDLTQPRCPGGDTVFHAECIAGDTRTDVDERPFDTLANQLEKNADAAARIVLKIDVEGAEWESLQAAPDSVLERVDQLAIEFHGADAEVGKYIDVVTRLNGLFHVAHLHFNNYSCAENIEPFPAYAYEVLFVNKRLGVLDEAQPDANTRPHALDAPNNPDAPDCQHAAKESGSRPV